jgi:tetratricopeptide (TPR) repeat protein
MAARMFADRLVFIGVISLLGIQCAYACDHAVGTIVSVEGVVEVRPAAALGEAVWTPARRQQSLCANDQIAVRERSRAAVQLVNQIVVRLDQRTTLTLQKLDADQPAEIGLLQGIVHVLTRFTRKFSVITPYLNAMVEGTEFTVMADAQARRGEVTVLEGAVRAANQNGEQVVVAGNTVAAGALDAPAAPLAVKPRDAIQWALYYPQIINVHDNAIASLDDQAQGAVKRARTLANHGQYAEALVVLGDPQAFFAVPALQSWYANLLLSVGRLDEARTALGSSVQLPLRSLIETVLGNAGQASLLAQQAVAASPDSAAAQLALSLALQSQSEIPQAVGAAQRATMLDPDFPLAWTRLAELELLNANARHGRSAAEHALQLDQDSAKAHTIFGFAEIMAGNPRAAQQAFDRAKRSESPDAQAWLGSGLVLIRAGQLAEGRQHLEVAAMLDPGNAELRNILTRAYLKEGRDGVAIKELELAERLDPANPGSWFTDALRKQQRGDPVGALQAYQHSLDLNDQRAVVRPCSLLDQDKAGRTLSLASTYRDLGFDGLMLATAGRAVAADPGSFAAHAFLAEAYGSAPRHETARVSEQLQSQLRAPIGMAPVAPQSLLTTLPIVGGPRAFTLQEFTPLLDRNPAGLQVGGLLGNQGTRGSSTTAFKAWDTVQVSAGHFYYDTDSAINDVPIRISANNLLLQWQLTAALQAQLEGRTERRDGGDVTQRVDPSGTEAEGTRYLKNDSVRFGLLLAPSARTEWLLSAVHRERLDISDDVVHFIGGRTLKNLERHTAGRKPTRSNYLESQALIHMGNWHLTSGIGYFRADSDVQAQSIVVDPAVQPGLVLQTRPLYALDLDVDHRKAYAYASYRTGGLRWDSGFSWDDFSRDDGFVLRRISSRFGGEYAWQNTRVRAALFHGVRGNISVEQSLDSTVFAGLNQAFDDLEGTRYRRAAVAVDHRWNAADASTGLEWSRRRLVVPNTGCSPAPCAGLWWEGAHHLYHSWAINSRWALDAGVRYESLRMDGQSIGNSNLPLEMHTWQAPLKIAYIPGNKWHVNAEWRWVKQSVRSQLSNQSATADSSFGIANFVLRYGLIASSWSVALELNNAFDRKFKFQNATPTAVDRPMVPWFAPERMVVMRLGLKL